MRILANSELQLDEIPDPDSDWSSISQFAHTFNGYLTWGSFEKCAEVANNRQPATLTDARTCLFFAARSWRHSGNDPDEAELEYLRTLLLQIRKAVIAGALQ